MNVLKDRIKCKCGTAMDSDEFLRKYNPAAALLNLLKNEPITTGTCDTTYSMLHQDILNVFRDYIRKYVNNPQDATGIIPCSYTDLATSGCKFELKSKSANLNFGLGIAMKACPSNPDMTFVSVVAKGALVDNMGKPCDATNTCGVGLRCQDASTIVSSRRSGGLWSLLSKTKQSSLSFRVHEAIQQGKDWLLDQLGPRGETIKLSLDAAANALRSLGETVAEGVDALQARRHFGRRLLLQPSDVEVYDLLQTAGLYDSGDGAPGCLTFSQAVANARAFAQAFFPDATVAQDASYNVCIPDEGFTTDSGDAVAKFFETNWGVQWKDEAIYIPFTSWDGALTRGRNVLDAARVDGSYFVGTTTALHPPAANTADKLLPVFGATCLGSAYFQVGEKIAAGVQAPGASIMFTFLMEQAMKMQQCRAMKREKNFVFARLDFMNHFALYTPVAWLSLLTKPPV